MNQMGLQIALNAMQKEINNWLFIAGLLSLVWTAILFTVLYFVVKTAVREGIREASLISSDEGKIWRSSGVDPVPSFMKRN